MANITRAVEYEFPKKNDRESTIAEAAMEIDMADMDLVILIFVALLIISSIFNFCLRAALE
ncbi:MAG: hypothetical protein IKE42_21410 [Aquamicrobium sp.]|uniref:hypothetical protein n=1 Tax=Caulobacter vibrioides TaxID=155892 RepID=UPI00103C5A77|nr:hypothetical protein [Caulobacter vibrioides]MBR2690418.1 hypothetical protein [Aquamicrobium sp.]